MNKSDKSSSLFKLIDRKRFEELVKKWGVDKGVRGFTTWELTQALISCFWRRTSLEKLWIFSGTLRPYFT